MLKFKNKKGFTIIELIVVMAIIGILVLLAMPKFMGHTKEAKFTKLISNAKQIENANERYYMDKNDWPRLSDVPYTSAQITAFSQKVYDTTGKEVTLDATGNYYDIDYNKISKYVNVPDERLNYIIQNPVGNVYALENLTQSAETRIINQSVTSIMLEKSTTSVNVSSNVQLIATVVPTTAVNKNVTWASSNTSVATVSSSGLMTGITAGTATITVKTVDGNYTSTCAVTVTVPFTTQIFNYTGNYQTFVVPATATYKLEVWGAQGGGSYGGKGGYSYGNINFTQGQVIYIYVGGAGEFGSKVFGGFNGGANSGTALNVKEGSGGGASDIRLVSTLLSTRVIVAGGGGGAGGNYGNDNSTDYGGAGGDIAGGIGGGTSNGPIAGGGSQSSGGSGGAYPSYSSAPSGTIGQGGNGLNSGGGGGGGYYGGGGCNFSGAGGGSGYVGGVTSGTMSSGAKTGNGSAKITFGS